MDTVPPDDTTQTTIQTIEKKPKIVKFSDLARPPGTPLVRPVSKPASKSISKPVSMDLKLKLENYRSIFNTSPKGGAAEKGALLKLAEFSPQLPDDDRDKHEFVRVAVDFYEGDEIDKEALFAELLRITPGIENPEDRLKAYRVLMRSKQCNEATKEEIGACMLAILETV